MILVKEEDKAGPSWSAIRPEAVPIQCPTLTCQTPGCSSIMHVQSYLQLPHKVKYGTGRRQLASRAMPEMLQLQGLIRSKSQEEKFHLKIKILLL